MNVARWSMWDWVKLTLCAGLDVFDFTVGRLFALFPYEEVGYAAFTVALWGWRGVFVLFEAVDFTEQIDAFIPLTTLIALLALRRKHRGAQTPDDPHPPAPKS